ncbi:MAG: hypothetical protein ACKOB1_03610, partial [Planctomycetia bacterium]
AELDRQIRQEEMMRNAFEAASKVAGFFGGGGNGGGDRGGQGGGQGGGPPRGATQEGVNKWRKQIIDSTTPEQRARYVEYRRAMDQRRKELGMPAGGPR